MSEKRILIVDDSSFDRELLVKALARKGGFTALEAESGDRCLEILERESVDLILMDVLMPGTIGTSTLAKIRENYNPIELPIIMVTSKSQVTDIVEAMQAGANDYITKPVNFDVALSRIATHLTLAALSKEMSRMKELTALNAMITTYNHEINTPLTTALACLGPGLVRDEAAVARLSRSLWRIADIVKKIREVTDKKEIEYGTYVGETKLVKI